MFLNIIFHAPMGRFQLETKLELPLCRYEFYMKNISNKRTEFHYNLIHVSE